MNKRKEPKTKRTSNSRRKTVSKTNPSQTDRFTGMKNTNKISDKFLLKFKEYFQFSECMFYSREYLSWQILIHMINTRINIYSLHFQIPQKLSWKQFNYHKLIGQGSFGKGFIASLKYRSENQNKKHLKICLVKMINSRKGENIENHYFQLINERDSLVCLSGTWTPKLYACFIERKIATIFVQEFIDGETITYIKKLIKTENGKDLYPLLLSALQDESTVKDIPYLTHRQFEIVQFYIAELLGALKFIHNQGILHRDLKENNILLTCSGHLKLIDFGLSKRKCSFYKSREKCSSANCSSSHLIEQYFCCSSRMWGNRYYAAPEYITEEKTEFDDKGDYWAAGIIIFQLLFGCRPYKLIVSDKVKELSDFIVNWKIKSFMKTEIIKQRCLKYPELISGFFSLISDENTRLHDGLLDDKGCWQPYGWSLLRNFDLLKMHEYESPVNIPSNKKLYSINNRISHSVIAKSFPKERYLEQLDCPYFNYVAPINNDLFDDVTLSL